MCEILLAFGLVRNIRNLNLRTARLGRFALLVSVDSFRSLLPLANATLWHRFLYSPGTWPADAPARAPVDQDICRL